MFQKSIEELGEKMIKMQIQQGDEEEYDDQVFVVNRKMDALKSLVT